MTSKLKKVRFGQLKKVMSDLGYDIKPVDQQHVAFVHAGRELFAVVPNLAAQADVRPIDLLSVQKTLLHERVIEKEAQFSELFSTDESHRPSGVEPASEQEFDAAATARAERSILRPRAEEAQQGGGMVLKDKLLFQMARRGLNGQKLARLSQVSDSEISRILQGKSLPGLATTFRLAKAMGVSIDYLADDSLGAEPPEPGDRLSDDERRILAFARKLGCREVLSLFETTRFLGYDIAMTRLVGGKPVMEIEHVRSEPHRSGTSDASEVVKGSRAASA